MGDGLICSFRPFALYIDSRGGLPTCQPTHSTQAFTATTHENRSGSFVNSLWLRLISVKPGVRLFETSAYRRRGVGSSRGRFFSHKKFRLRKVTQKLYDNNKDSRLVLFFGNQYISTKTNEAKLNPMNVDFKFRFDTMNKQIWTHHPKMPNVGQVPL